MKSKILLILFFTSNLLLQSQNKYEWLEYGITFSSKIKYNFEPMYEEDEDKKTLWRLDSDEMGIEVEVCKNSDQSTKFIDDIEFAAQEIAYDMEYKPIRKGNHIKGNFRGYFVKSKDKDFNGTKYPVIIAAIIDDENDLSFEIVIDCYNGNLENGLELLSSIKYIPKS